MRDGDANANALARVSKDEDERPSAPSCFETPRSSREECGLRDLARAARLLSMRAGEGVHFGETKQQQDACLVQAKNQPAGVEKRRRRGLPVSGLFFTGSFATAARGVHGHRNPGRLVRQSGSSAHCAGAGRNNDPGASDEATVRARTRIGFADLQEFTGEPRSVWPVTRGQKRVEDARRRAYHPRVHHSSQESSCETDGLPGQARQ